MTKPNLNSQRVEAHRQKKIAAGYKRLSLWVRPEYARRVRRYIEDLEDAAVALEKEEATDAA